MKEKCNPWEKSLFFTVLFFTLGLCLLTPKLSVRADYKDEWQGWTGYVNDDGTFTVTGCHNDANIKGNVLEIPSSIGGMRVTAVSGESQGTSDAYFGVFFPELITELILPDTVEHISEYEEDYTIFRKLKNLQKLRLPNNVNLQGAFHYDPEYHPKLEEVTLRDLDDLSKPWTITGIKKLTFHEGVTLIKNSRSFLDLLEINLPSTIQEFAWKDAPRLTTLNCPKPLNEINITALAGCESLHIPVTVDPYAQEEDLFGGYDMDYSNSGITELNIKNMYRYAFLRSESHLKGCKFLQAINILSKADGCNYYTEDGVLYTSSTPDGRNMKILHTYPGGKSTTGNYTLPADVAEFDGNAFSGCKFSSITIPENITPDFHWISATPGAFFTDSYKIRVVKGSSAAYYYDETESVLASSIYSRSDIMFGGLTNRPTVDPSRIEFYTGSTYTITYDLNGGTNAPDNPASYRAGDDYVWLDDPTREGYEFLGWKRNDIPNRYEDTTQPSVGAGYFQNYTFTAEWEKIEASSPTDGNGSILSSFVGTVLKNVLGGDYKVTGTGLEVEYTGPSRSGVKNVTIPNTIQANGTTYKVTSIAPNAFRNNKKLISVKVGGNVATIGANAFSGCKKLRKITLGSGLTSINAKAFYKCTSLVKVTIPKKVKRIGKQAFGNCSKLNSIIIKSTMLTTKSVGSKAFSGIRKGATVKVPAKSLKAYKTLLKKKGLPASARIKK